MNDITLYEAMKYIDNYITEAAPRGAYKKYNKIYTDKLDKLSDEMKGYSKKDDMLQKIARYNKHAKSALEDNEARMRLARKEVDAINDKYLKKNGTYPAIVKHEIDAAHKCNNGTSASGRKTIDEMKKRFGQGEDPRSKLEKKPAGLYTTKESTKLNIYESYEAGIITEEEKYELLDLINSFEE